MITVRSVAKNMYIAHYVFNCFNIILIIKFLKGELKGEKINNAFNGCRWIDGCICNGERLLNCTVQGLPCD